MSVYENNAKVQSFVTEVVLVDVEKFSLLSAEEQVRVAVILNGELELFLNVSTGQSAMSVDEVVAGFASTGDGFYVILQPEIAGFGLVLGLSLRAKLQTANVEGKRCIKGVRIGVHRGVLSKFVDITQRECFVGPVMNDCSRLLSAKPENAPTNFLMDSSYVICSKSAFESFSNAFNYIDENSYFRKMGVITSPDIAIKDKHDLLHSAAFVEAPRFVAFNPPRPHDFDERVKAKLAKYIDPLTNEFTG
ncbi:MAG TPA: hypothetical protein HPP97_10120 [Desulfuromonadales bacterium]|nr:hypothetical protein [Desulfuromonadales bacterium]